MPHFHHILPFLSRVQLYDVGESVIERQIDMLDELLNDDRVDGVVRRSAQRAKDALGMLRANTLQPERLNGPRRETVERARPSFGVDLISGEPIGEQP